jgi:bacterioferritin-associated ferredoxin
VLVYACICHAVTSSEVVDVVRAGATTEETVGEVCGAGTGCGSCLERICAIIRTVDPDHGQPLLRRVG